MFLRALTSSIALLALAVPAANAEDNLPGVLVDPERPVSLKMSNRDLNRIVCRGGQIEDYRFSSEKGIQAEATDSDFFVKFSIRQVGPQLTYVTQRSEFFVKCAGQWFTLYGQPTDVASQTIFLNGAQGLSQAASVAEFAPLSREERALKITKAVLREEYPDTYHVDNIGMIDFDRSIPGARVFLRKRISIDGLDLAAAEYHLYADRDMSVDERMFLKPQFGSGIYAVTVDQPALQRGETGRVVIVSRGGSN